MWSTCGYLLTGPPAPLNNHLEMQLSSLLSFVLTEIIPNPAETQHHSSASTTHTRALHILHCALVLCMPQVREQLYSMLHHADKALIKILQLITMMT